MVEDKLVLSDPIRFYNGEVILYFCSEKNGKPAHSYYLETPNGLKFVDGVTTICNILDHSVYLIPWSCKMMYLKLLKTVPRTNDRVNDILWNDFVKILEESKSAHKEHLEDAGDVGKSAHQWIEDSIYHSIYWNNGIVEQMKEPKPTDERAVNCGLAAHKWMTEHNVRWLKTERKIFSRKYKYAGTMDGLAIVDSCMNPVCCPRLYQDELSLIDWKSSNYLKTEYLYQTAAYLAAEVEEHGKEIAARWILRLGKDDGKFEAWYEREVEQDFNTFLACLALKRANETVENRMRDAKKLRTFTKRETAKKNTPVKKLKILKTEV